ncbi:glycosyltransferase family 2 protein [Patescibacteria group bacterium]
MTYQISAIVTTRKTNEKYLEKALKGVEFCNEIVVVVDDDKLLDRGSVKIAKKFTKNIYSRKLDNFANQKNFALKKASCKWVLFIDSDEIIEPKLKNEIIQAIKGSDIDGYEIPFKHIIFGKWIRYTGWYPSWRLTLFKAEKVRFSRGVHEQILISGKTEKLKEHIIHYNYDDIFQFVEKMNIYTDLEAKELNKNNIKFSVLSMFFRSMKEFLSRYFKNLGFLDGIHGLVLSSLMTYYWLLVYIKLWSIQKK